MPYKRFACLLSYRTGLCLRKVEDDYIQVLLGVGLLKMDGNILTLAEREEGKKK